MRVAFETADGVPNASQPVGDQRERGREKNENAHAVLRVAIQFPCDANQAKETRCFQQAHQCGRFASALGLNQREENVERNRRRPRR